MHLVKKLCLRFFGVEKKHQLSVPLILCVGGVHSAISGYRKENIPFSGQKEIFRSRMETAVLRAKRYALSVCGWFAPVLRTKPVGFPLLVLGGRRGGRRRHARSFRPSLSACSRRYWRWGAQRGGDAYVSPSVGFAGADFRVARLSRRLQLRLCREAVSSLAERMPLFSARTVMTGAQIWTMCGLLTMVSVSCIVWPMAALRVLVLLASAGFCIGAASRFVLVIFGIRTRLPDLRCGACASPVCPSETVAEYFEDTLPVYTVLVPLFREAAVLPELAQALRRLRYPRDKLDIKFVVEEDDAETREVAESLSASGPFETIVVPPCHPRTKPKACNYALRFATGAYLVIYDAEDRPDPDQLLKAARAFRVSPPSVGCFQARLKIDNGEESFLSALFALDYEIWFTALLPGLDRLRAPMPLGGTSNHFRTAALRQVGAWDPYNVTEDADLGLRLAQYGYAVAMLDSDTLEEAPIYFGQWLKQRTRWLKGYMQTLLVHFREPGGVYRRIGLRGIAALLMFIGGVVASALINPVLWACFIGALLAPGLGGHRDGIEMLAIVSGCGLFVANMLLAGQILLSVRWRRHPRSILYAFGIVVFWMMVSVAAWRAVVQLLFRPHLWEKTPHGQSRRRGLAT